jgi:uroporphyrinogen decarboxylase
VTYYSKKTGPDHWDALEGLPIAALGVDWNHNIAEVLKRYGTRYAIQGNVDPHWLFLEPSELERRLREVFGQVLALPAEYRKGWVCGLGHGVLPKTPEDNVRLFLRLQKELFKDADDADDAKGAKGAEEQGVRS